MEPVDDLHCDPLLRPWFTPLLRPDIAAFVKCPGDLANLGLIDAGSILDPEMMGSAWEPWCRINGVEPPMDFAVNCDDTATAVETAMATGYVAIAGSFLAHEHVAKGELVAPFNTAIAPNSRFWLVCRNGFETSPEYRWFLAAIQESSKAIDAASKDIRLFYPSGSPVST